MSGSGRDAEYARRLQALFATSSIARFVKFHSGARIELIVTYRGLNKNGCRFAGRLLGTVIRNDLQKPLPDVRARLRVSDYTPDEEVLIRCS